MTTFTLPASRCDAIASLDAPAREREDSVLRYRGWPYRSSGHAAPAPAPDVPLVYRGTRYRRTPDLPASAPNAARRRYRGSAHF